MQIFSTMLMAAAGVLSAAVDPAVLARHSLQTRASGDQMAFSNNIINSAAYNVFLTADIRYPAGTEPPRKAGLPNVQSKVASTSKSDEDPNMIYVLQCTNNGFRGDCMVFGAPKGQCVSYFDFNQKGKRDISDRFNNKITSLSTNTGGMCQFYKYRGCDKHNNDRGMSASYNYDLAVANPQDTRARQYENRITSWRC
ncbi:hypothetical protein PspLS_11277 [Pyricularia sp. CBS 133598]|nr:hypothetical protein PspLS_11277 [Pyricularia sp. CBS 133598]